MVTRVINYTNLDGETQQEIAMFNINKMDRIRFANKHPRLQEEAVKLQEDAKRASENPDDSAQEAVVAKFIMFVEEIIKAGYGIRQGNKFNRDESVVSNFIGSEACEEFEANLLMEPGALVEFLKELFPDADFSVVEGV